MTEDLVLYTNPMSRGRIARWMLEETEIPYQVEFIGFGERMKSADYLALNPMGKVPALRHGRALVTETAAICAYLAETFPEAGLLPRTDVERASYYRWLFFVAGPLESAVTNRAFQCEPPADKARSVGYGTYDDVVSTLEKAVSAHDYIAGEHFTAADVYVGAQVAWGLRFKTLEERPAFVAYAARVANRPAARRAAELDDAALPKG
ncbi:glutathione S-transferase [Rhizobium rhizosphaerae]|uniref:Glutathione S-transferase n=1 Tax=Xaviernesmea rhizosphaerae TaxID=1672749 RepID=A0A1Q9ANF5_9HYPH|nr:glutathione S-transferase family protein [Xaviernesmea rhizosphaerae]OLP56866.1 glutathione S-transferase [Xaviernesmea rhizosphaerae]OQP88245.1 glutathione S-transferase [Xaviernesmea rhizosphaerae]